MKANGGQDAENVDQLLEQQDKLIEEIFSHDDKDKDGYIGLHYFCYFHRFLPEKVFHIDELGRLKFE